MSLFKCLVCSEKRTVMARGWLNLSLSPLVDSHPPARFSLHISHQQGELGFFTGQLLSKMEMV